ncbi:MAG: Rv3654c family TadE-like protein [Ornithinimicrobium sp.]
MSREPTAEEAVSCPATRGPTGDRGSGTVLGLATMGVLLSVLLGLGLLGGAVIARQQAQNAADLGAVAGAQTLKTGGDAHAACARAAELVEANGGQLDDCSVSGSLGQAWAADGGPHITLRVHRAVASFPRWVAKVSANAGLVAMDE